MSGPIVSDAGPLHYLILVGCADALPSLFERLLIPPEVRDELLHISTPQRVKDWMRNPPPWLKIEPATPLYQLPSLHKGETAALQLARLSQLEQVVTHKSLQMKAALQKVCTKVILRPVVLSA